ncbi:MAG: hypothetical protein JEY79_01065 [Pseudodesulfovibrio sp.]|nr:hypothetical protein [Pseudodesulfovibrio sp.]
MIRRVETQPEALRGFEYGSEEYEWLEFVSPDGEVYAVCGLAFRGPDFEEAWLYWRIVRFSVAALRELRKVDVPKLKDYCRGRGASVAFVATDDPADVDFQKMVGFMGFTVQMIGFQSLED